MILNSFILATLTLYLAIGILFLFSSEYCIENAAMHVRECYLVIISLFLTTCPTCSLAYSSLPAIFF